MKIFRFFLVVVVLILTSATSYASVEVTCFSGNFIRGKGSPIVETHGFQGLTGTAVLRVINGASDDSYKKVSSSVIKVNGIAVLSQDDFNQNVGYLEAEFDLGEQNTISVEVRGKPGSNISVEIIQMVDKVSMVGTEGGIISLDNGVEILVPANAVEEPVLLAIKQRSIDDYKLSDEEKEIREFYAVIQILITGNVLSDNIDISIPKPNNITNILGVWLSKIIALEHEDVLVNIDTISIDGDNLISNDPANPGIMNSGTYVVNKVISECGVSKNDSFFKIAGNNQPTCDERINLYSYFQGPYRDLMAQKNIYNKSIDNSLAANDFIIEASNVAGHLASVVSVGMTPTNALTFPADMTSALATNTISFASGVGIEGGDAGAEVAGIWLNLGSCLFFEIYQPIPCADELFLESLRSVSRLFTTYDIYKFSKRLNEINIAEKYLRLFFIFGSSRAKVADNLNIDSGSTISDIIKEIAKHATLYDAMWPMPDYSEDEIIKWINLSIGRVEIIHGQIDPDYDGVASIVDNCPYTCNPNQADSDSNGIGDVCDPNDDVDNDGDGYTENQGDLNDSDNTIFPGSPEISSDGIDNDNDGKIDEYSGHLVDLPEYPNAIYFPYTVCHETHQNLGTTYIQGVEVPRVLSFDMATEIAIINTNDQSLDGELRCCNNQGEVVASLDITLMPKGRKKIIVGNLFVNAGDISYVVCNCVSDDASGYTRVVGTPTTVSSWDGSFSTTYPTAKKSTNETLFGPWIVSEQWYNLIHLLNTNNTTKNITIKFGGGGNYAVRDLILGPHERRSFLASDLLPEGDDIRYAVIDGAEGIIGLMQMGDGAQDFGYLLPGNIFGNLYCPETFYDKNNLWAGTVIYNPSISNNDITVTPYSKEGDRLYYSHISLSGQSSFAFVYQSFFYNPETDWFKIQSSHPVAAIEVFGDGAGAGANNLVNVVSRKGLFPSLGGGSQSSITLVNVENSASTVNFTAYDDDGNMLATKVTNLNPYSSMSVNLYDFFNGQDISNATYVDCVSDKHLVGHQINWSPDLGMMDTLPWIIYDLVEPTAPTGVRPEVHWHVDQITGNAGIYWDKNDSATEYRVYWSTNPGVTKDSKILTSRAFATGCSHDDVLLGNRYYYRVSALNSAGESPLSDEISVYIQGLIAPEFTGINLGVDFNQYYCTLYWNRISEARSYNVYWGTSPDVTKSSEKLSTISTSYKHTGLDEGYTYYYKVAAVNMFGEESELSAVESVYVPEAIIPINPVVASYVPPGSVAQTYYQPGDGFTPNSNVTLHFIAPDGTPFTDSESTDSNGHYDHYYAVTSSIYMGGTWTYYAVDEATGQESDPVNYYIVGQPRVTVSKTLATTGDTLLEPGYGFTPYGIVTLHFIDPTNFDWDTVTERADQNGSYTYEYEVTSGTARGTWEYYAVDDAGMESKHVFFTID